MTTTTTTSQATLTVFGDVHALRMTDGAYELFTRTPEGLRTVGTFDNPAVAMNVLDLLDES
jgi:hypothetical protein